jgi:molybdopterin-guanine dinucleotide biosynthesis protein A
MVVAGLLLTGGASTRMGVPKATLLVEGEPLATRAARVLREVCDPVLEVGPGFTELEQVAEPDAHEGPLAGFVAGIEALDHPGAVVLLACDLPFVTVDVLRDLVAWPGDGSVVPVDASGRLQPACARYSLAAQARARAAFARGERALARVLDDPTDVTRFTPADERALIDVDTPEEAARWGVERPGSLGT